MCEVILYFLVFQHYIHDQHSNWVMGMFTLVTWSHAPSMMWSCYKTWSWTTFIYNLVFEFVKNEMGRDFVHACGAWYLCLHYRTFAYIIWPGDIASSEHMDNLFMMCPWNLFLLSMLFISMYMYFKWKVWNKNPNLYVMIESISWLYIVSI